MSSMKNSAPSVRQLNRTFIGSVLFIDIVGYSCGTVPDQLAIKEVFNNLLAEAVQTVAPSERIMVDTGDGAAVAFLGDPEDALFAALSLRDAIDAGKATLGEPGFVRMGINLGPLKTVRDINSHTNMIGDGVNDAQRVMSFAEPGQVMVSHAYFDIISRFSRDYTKLFVYEGTRHDKHVREHEVYRFGPTEGADNLTEQLTEKMRDRSRARQPDEPRTASLPATASMAYASRAREPGTVAAPPVRKRIASRLGLVSMAIGIMAATGAIWSWTDKSGLQTPDALLPAALAATGKISESEKPVNLTFEKVAALAATTSAEKIEQPFAKLPAASATRLKAAEKRTDASEMDHDTAVPTVKPGTVKLAVWPWGEIYVDGSKRGVSPPLKSLSLAPGKHRIEIRNGQFMPHKRTITVRSSSETTVHYVF